MRVWETVCQVSPPLTDCWQRRGERLTPVFTNPSPPRWFPHKQTQSVLGLILCLLYFSPEELSVLSLFLLLLSGPGCILNTNDETELRLEGLGTMLPITSRGQNINTPGLARPTKTGSKRRIGVTSWVSGLISHHTPSPVSQSGLIKLIPLLISAVSATRKDRSKTTQSYYLWPIFVHQSRGLSQVGRRWGLSSRNDWASVRALIY